MIAWIDIDPATFAPQVELAMKFIVSSIQKGGSYGSTQATVLSLQALLKYSKKFGGLKGAGSFTLTVDSRVLSVFNFDQADQNVNSIDFGPKINKYYTDLGTKPAQMVFKVQVDDGYTYNEQQ